MTTYMWMFCEGFYLHKLIAASFAEQRSLTMYYFIGWGMYLLPFAIAYSIALEYTYKIIIVIILLHVEQ